MKTITKLTLAGITAALLTASAMANDTELRAIDNHHGAATYYRTTQAEGQKNVTVGVYTQGQAVGQAPVKMDRQPGTFREVSTPHGPISYYAPAE